VDPERAEGQTDRKHSSMPAAGWPVPLPTRKLREWEAGGTAQSPGMRTVKGSQAEALAAV